MSALVDGSRHSSKPLQQQSSATLRGMERMLTTSEQRMVTGGSVISERIVEHEIKVPKKVMREEIRERVMVVPEKVMREDYIEEVQKVRERIIEIAKPVIKEKIVEVPQIEYVEKVIEVPEIVYQDKIIEVPRKEYVEKIVEVPRVVRKEKIVEVPEIEYRDVFHEKIVEVPDIREEVVIKHVPVPQYVDTPVPRYVTVEVPEDIDRAIPVPVEATTTFEFLMPQLKAKYQKVQIPIYAPRFVEVPVPAELMDSQLLSQAEHLSAQIAQLAAQSAPSLCEVEKLAEYAKQANFQANLSTQNLQAVIEEAWRNGSLQVTQDHARYSSHHRSHKYRS